MPGVDDGLERHRALCGQVLGTLRVEGGALLLSWGSNGACHAFSDAGQVLAGLEITWRELQRTLVLDDGVSKFALHRQDAPQEIVTGDVLRIQRDGRLRLDDRLVQFIVEKQCAGQIAALRGVLRIRRHHASKDDNGLLIVVLAQTEGHSQISQRRQIVWARCEVDPIMRDRLLKSTLACERLSEQELRLEVGGRHCEHQMVLIDRRGGVSLLLTCRADLQVGGDHLTQIRLFSNEPLELPNRLLPTALRQQFPAQ